jgi:hypothetical protein
MTLRVPRAECATKRCVIPSRGSFVSAFSVDHFETKRHRMRRRLSLSSVTTMLRLSDLKTERFLSGAKMAALPAALDLMRRLPPRKLKENLASTVSLVPD